METNYDQLLVSIIVPVYNVMPYLKNCIESILTQTYQNIEVILVDDGSTDNLEDYLETLNDSRLKVFHKPNGGVSSARNLGIEKATGDYLTFIDGDDTVSPDFISESLSFAMSASLDMVVGGLTKDYGSRKTSFGKALGTAERQIFVGDELQDVIAKTIAYEVPHQVYLNSFFMSGCVCKLIRKDIVKGIRFNEAISIGEDTLFNVQILLRCKRVGFQSSEWYVYRILHGSAVGKHRPDAFERAKNLINCLYDATSGVEGLCMYVRARGLREFEGACLASFGHAASGMTFVEAWRLVSDQLNAPFWLYVFPPDGDWPARIGNRRYRLFGSLCQRRRAFLICIYTYLLRLVRDRRDG